MIVKEPCIDWDEKLVDKRQSQQWESDLDPSDGIAVGEQFVELDEELRNILSEGYWRSSDEPSVPKAWLNFGESEVHEEAADESFRELTLNVVICKWPDHGDRQQQAVEKIVRENVEVDGVFREICDVIHFLF